MNTPPASPASKRYATTPLPWLMAMEWRDLLFAHWPVPHDLLRGLIPPRLTLETRDGAAWLGVVPFRMTGVRPRLALLHFARYLAVTAWFPRPLSRP